MLITYMLDDKILLEKHNVEAKLCMRQGEYVKISAIVYKIKKVIYDCDLQRDDYWIIILEK